MAFHHCEIIHFVHWSHCLLDLVALCNPTAMGWTGADQVWDSTPCATIKTHDSRLDRHFVISSCFAACDFKFKKKKSLRRLSHEYHVKCSRDCFVGGAFLFCLQGKCMLTQQICKQGLEMLLTPKLPLNRLFLKIQRLPTYQKQKKVETLNVQRHTGLPGYVPKYVFWKIHLLTLHKPDGLVIRGCDF